MFGTICPRWIQCHKASTNLYTKSNVKFINLLWPVRLRRQVFIFFRVENYISARAIKTINVQILISLKKISQYVHWNVGVVSDHPHNELIPYVTSIYPYNRIWTHQFCTQEQCPTNSVTWFKDYLWVILYNRQFIQIPFVCTEKQKGRHNIS